LWYFGAQLHIAFPPASGGFYRSFRVIMEVLVSISRVLALKRAVLVSKIEVTKTIFEKSVRKKSDIFSTKMI
jgi:hypothetical protein